MSNNDGWDEVAGCGTSVRIGLGVNLILFTPVATILLLLAGELGNFWAIPFQTMCVGCALMWPEIYMNLKKMNGLPDAERVGKEK